MIKTKKLHHVYGYDGLWDKRKVISCMAYGVRIILNAGI